MNQVKEELHPFLCSRCGHKFLIHWRRRRVDCERCHQCYRWVVERKWLPGDVIRDLCAWKEQRP